MNKYFEKKNICFMMQSDIKKFSSIKSSKLNKYISQLKKLKNCRTKFSINCIKNITFAINGRSIAINSIEGKK